MDQSFVTNLNEENCKTANQLYLLTPYSSNACVLKLL